MSDELISKKDLLEMTGISYGQLYRWKRKDLIPEDWFIRKSTFTGQETFFPREKILERIEKIQTMKESLSLDELANMFSPTNATKLSLSKSELLQKNIVSEAVLRIFIELNGEVNEFSYQQILHLYILEKLLKSGEISLEEGKMVNQVLQDFRDINQKESELIIARKFGISTCLVCSGHNEIVFEKDTKIITRLSISSCMEELQTVLL